MEPVNIGMPPLNIGGKPWSYFEFWPVWVFYTPVVFYWLYLGIRYRSFGLPLIANPNIPLGGMVGESKSDILRSAGDFASQYILPFVSHQRDQSVPTSKEAEVVIEKAQVASLSLPLVVKPDNGCRGRAVRVIHNVSELIAYLDDFPTAQQYLLQTLAPWRAEAGIFYIRKPGEKKGRVTSITLKYVPTVIGDGVSNLDQLICKSARASKLRKVYLDKNGINKTRIPGLGEEVSLTFAGSHCRGSIFRNGNVYISQELDVIVDRIMCDFPDFHYGRLDIKFEDILALQQGKNFCVIEVNGASSEATHIWDSRGRLSEVFLTLFEQYRTLFNIGKILRDKGLQPPSASVLIRAWLKDLKVGSKFPEGQ